MATRSLTRNEAKAALGDMPERTFARWCAKGMPCKGDGARARFPWPEIYRWIIEQVERRAREAAKPVDYNEAKAREMAARAELAELEVATKRGELMTVAQYDEVVGAAFARVRAQLTNLPTKAAPELVGLAAAPEALAKVQGFVDEVMAELHTGADVPTEPDADSD